MGAFRSSEEHYLWVSGVCFMTDEYTYGYFLGSGSFSQCILVPQRGVLSCISSNMSLRFRVTRGLRTSAATLPKDPPSTGRPALRSLPDECPRTLPIGLELRLHQSRCLRCAPIVRRVATKTDSLTQPAPYEVKQGYPGCTKKRRKAHGIEGILVPCRYIVGLRGVAQDSRPGVGSFGVPAGWR